MGDFCMLRRFRACSPALLLVLCASAAYGAEPSAPPLEVYGSLPRTEVVELSADGSLLAIVSLDDDRFVLTIRRAGGKTIATIPLADMKFSGLSWAGDEYLVVYAHHTERLGVGSKSDRELTDGIIVDARTGAQKPLLALSPDYLSAIKGRYGFYRRDGHWFGYYGLFPSEPPSRPAAPPGWQPFPDLYRINFDTGAAERVATGSARSLNWVLDANAEIIAESEYDSNSGDWKVFKPASPGQPLLSGNSPFKFGLGGLSRTPNTVLVASGGSETEIKELNLNTGQTETLLPPDKVKTLIRGRVTHLLLGAVTVDDSDSSSLMFDPTLDRNYRSVAKEFAGHDIKLVSVSTDLNSMLVHISGHDTAGTWELVNFPGGKGTLVAKDYPQLPDDAIGSTQTIDYKAADGLALQGVLTLPPGKAGKKLPLVVLVHSGPQGRALPRFNWIAQALATRGYAVFQPNFRGSDGYGLAFRNAGFGEWGRKMQTDISDGVAALAEKGIIDPHRVCIAGSSYGGYAALAGVTLQNGLYRCAVSYAGISDLRAFLNVYAEEGKGHTEHYEQPGMRFELSYLGAGSANDRSLDRISPLWLADKADAPILLIHGDRDTVVRVDQSLDMAKALKDAGKPVELVTLDGEDHSLSRSATRLQMLKAMVAFIEKNNPPSPRNH